MKPQPPISRKARLHPAIKAAIALAAVALAGFLFVRSVRDARAEPYEVSAAQLRNWTLAADANSSAGALVSLRPSPELPMSLFRQLFSRQMESMQSATELGVALALRHEVAEGVTAAEVLAMARAAGLEQAAVTPRCIAHRRVSQRGGTRQLYFLWVDLPGFDRFRQALAARGAVGYSAAGLSPVMMMAAEPGFEGWHPIVVDEDRDCVAPVKVV